MFEKGKVYRNDSGTSLDIQVYDIVEESPDKCKLLIAFLFRKSHNVCHVEEITITSDKYKDWYEIAKVMGT